MNFNGNKKKNKQTTTKIVIPLFPFTEMNLRYKAAQYSLYVKRFKNTDLQLNKLQANQIVKRVHES